MLLNEKNSRLTLCGELALLVAVIINSFSVVLMLYSGSGISAISSVPFAFSEAFPKLTLGTWTYIFQGLLIASLMYLRKKFIASYMFSFVVGFVFSQFLDLFELYINLLPQAFSWRVLYFVVSYILICIGIALSNRCGLPIIPTDLFPRELSAIIKICENQNHLRCHLSGDYRTANTAFARPYRRTRNRHHPRSLHHG